MKVLLTIHATYEMPDDDADRIAAYGTDDPIVCANLDWEGDPEMVLLDSVTELVAVKLIEPSDV